MWRRWGKLGKGCVSGGCAKERGENGRTLEQEAREILRRALDRGRVPPQKLGTAIHELFKPLGGVELEIPPREPMPIELNTIVRQSFLYELKSRMGPIKRFGHGSSLYSEEGGQRRFLIRYSKVFENGTALWGLTEKDLSELEGYPSYLCLLWPQQGKPLLLPVSEFAVLFRSSTKDRNGLYLATTYCNKENGAIEFRISNPARKFDVSAYVGWQKLELMTV